MTKKRTDHDVAFDELSQLTPKPSPDSSKADAIQRVIEAAKDNHGDDCEAWRCLHCGRYCDVTSHRFTPRPCTCGLDAALSLLSVPAQQDDKDHGEPRLNEVAAEIERALDEIQRTSFLVDYAVIGRGAGGLEAVVEASTATHAILFIRRVLRKVSVSVSDAKPADDRTGAQAQENNSSDRASVEEARHVRICTDEWQKRAREAESLLAESHAEIQRLTHGFE